MRILILILATSFSCFGQSLVELVPWMGLSKEVTLGMSVKDFRNVKGNVKPMGFADEKITDTYEGGFFENNFSSNEIESTKGLVLYNFVAGKLVAIYWANKEEQNLELTSKIRNNLQKQHGNPTLYYSAKTQGEAIAKVGNEVFEPNGSNEIKIVLRSATDGLEVSIIDFNLETRQSFESLFNNYESSVSQLKKRGLEELGAEETKDLLSTLRSGNHHKSRKPVMKDRPNGALLENVINNKPSNLKKTLEVAKKKTIAEKESIGNQNWILWILGVVILVALVIVVGAKFRKG